MEDINKKIDALIALLEKHSTGSIDNVKKLAEDVEYLKNKVYEDTKTTYDSIKDSLEKLKNKVREKDFLINNLDKTQYNDEINIKISYYTTLISMKNEIMNYNIVNLDEVVEAFDEFENSRSSFNRKIEDIFQSSYTITNKTNYELITYIYNSLEKELEFFKNYELQVSKILDRISMSTLKIKDAYSELCNSEFEEFTNLKLDYEVRIGRALNQTIDLEKMMNDFDGSIDSEKEKLKNNELEIINYYDSLLDKNYKEFEDQSQSLINQLEKRLSEELDVKDVVHNKNIVSSFSSELKKNPKNKKLYSKLEKSLDNDELKDIVTHAYKNFQGDLFKEYKDKNKEIEKEYTEAYTKARLDSLKYRYMMKVSPIDSVVKKYTDNIDKQKEASSLYQEYILKRYVLLDQYNITLIKLSDAIKKIELTYKNDIKLIDLSLKKDIKNFNNDFVYDVGCLKEDLLFNTSSYNDLYSEIYREELKNLALLEYEINISKLHRNYVNAKGILYICSALFKNSQELDLLKPRYELIKIIEEYDMSRSVLENSYNSQVEMLNRTKQREELTVMSDYKFAISLLNHRLASIDELLDMTREEYKLRIEVLREIKSDYENYSTDRVDTIIGEYLDKINRLNEIKELNLNSLQQKIKYFSDGSDANYVENIERCNEILEDFKVASSKIQKLIKDNPEIKRYKDNINYTNELIINYISANQKIRDDGIREALLSLEKIEDDFDNIITNIYNFKSTDYVAAFNEYKLSYLVELNRINEALDTLSSSKIEKLNEIANYYKNDFYKDKYLKHNEEHKKKANELYRALLDKYSEIENSDNLFKNEIDDPYKEHMQHLSVLNEDKDNTQKTISLEYDNNLKLIKEEFLKNLKSVDEKEIELIDIYNQEKDNRNELILDSFKELDKLNSNSEKSFKNIEKEMNKKYSFEFYAFKRELDDRIKTKEKELEEKYKNINVYDLLGKK
ncbi:MAG: hypothetical protein K6G38_04470 [Gammaproteobacteria bacterium]|nr:hypothetical protein [Gammaproteobacteria bacterium]